MEEMQGVRAPLTPLVPAPQLPKDLPTQMALTPRSEGPSTPTFRMVVVPEAPHPSRFLATAATLPGFEEWKEKANAPHVNDRGPRGVDVEALLQDLRTHLDQQLSMHFGNMDAKMNGIRDEQAQFASMLKSLAAGGGTAGAPGRRTSLTSVGALSVGTRRTSIRSVGRRISDLSHLAAAPTATAEDDDDSDLPEDERKLQATYREHMEKSRLMDSKPKGRSGDLQNLGGKKDNGVWYDGENIAHTWFRKFATYVKGNSFDYLMGAFIFLNIIFLGLQVDLKVQTKVEMKDSGIYVDTNNQEDPPVYRIIETVFAFIFTLELLCRFIADKGCCCSLWILFDSIVVVGAIIEEIVKYGIGGETFAGHLSVLRMLRIFKVMRTFKVIRVIRAFRELRVVVMSMVACLRSLFWTLCVLYVLIYMFAIFILVELCSSKSAYEDTQSGSKRHELFSSLSKTMMTLFQSVTTGMLWSEPTVALADLMPLINVLMAVFVATVIFAVQNTVTGIFVDQSIKSVFDDCRNVLSEEGGMRDALVAKFRTECYAADVMGTGFFTSATVEGIFKASKDMRKRLKSFDVDVRDVVTLFELAAGRSRKLSLLDVDEFMRDCLRSRGLAKNVDVVASQFRLKVLERAYADVEVMLREGLGLGLPCLEDGDEGKTAAPTAMSTLANAKGREGELRVPGAMSGAESDGGD
eukprot:TRINITY_DN13112_c0_g1_i1.p1 TRINITY_DN13112_c0_g1~~TRINITY_DN13112_c0_g1_i1.p1  ORF type:complete len:708 (+),score=178.76 TRINITY_DN13112_c0_g1_i1:51-2126(+)